AEPPTATRRRVRPNAATEVFGLDQDTEVLARFHTPTGTQKRQRVRRRVRHNAVVESGARIAAAINARDAAGAARHFADAMQTLHHPTGVVFGRNGLMDTFERLVQSDGLRFHREPLATLGDILGLWRQLVSFDSTDSPLGPIGAVELETVMLEE